MIRGEVQVKLCECGCKLPAPIAKFTDHRKGHIKDQPVRFIRGHHGRGKQRPRQDLAERFWLKVDKNGPTIRPELGPCWLWTGYRNMAGAGYGTIRVNGRNRQATHIALELAGWILPFEWSQILHLCDNPPCVRPDHPRIDTTQANVIDMVVKGRQARGEHHGIAKLDLAEVAEIRALYQRGMRGRGYRALAKMFGVTGMNIKAIVCCKTWTGQ